MGHGNYILLHIFGLQCFACDLRCILLVVDQGDVQYFIGVQLDGTERVQNAAAKDGAMLVCAYFTKNLHVCARYLIKYKESKEEQIKMPDICLAANMLSKEAFCCGCLQYLLAFSNIKILLNI